MKLTTLISIFTLLAIPYYVQAINVGEVTSIMGPEKASLSKEISNPTDSARFVSVTVERISSPMAEGVVIPMADKSELLSTPASMIMPANAKENFRFFYKGPEDSSERYYRISWTDEPVMELDNSSNKKRGEATTSAIIGTILVVAPRKENFDFTHQGGLVTNTGNSSFRVVAYGPCKVKEKDDGSGCRERYYILPGKSVRITHTDTSNKKTRIGIWHGEQYINVN